MFAALPPPCWANSFMRATTGFVDRRRGMKKLMLTARMTTRKKTPILRATYASVTSTVVSRDRPGKPGVPRGAARNAGSLPRPWLQLQERELEGRPQAAWRRVRIGGVHPPRPVRVVERD